MQPSSHQPSPKAAQAYLDRETPLPRPYHPIAVLSTLVLTLSMVLTADASIRCVPDVMPASEQCSVCKHMAYLCGMHAKGQELSYCHLKRMNTIV